MSGRRWMNLLPKASLLFIYSRESTRGYLKPDDVYLKLHDMKVYTIFLNYTFKEPEFVYINSQHPGIFHTILSDRHKSSADCV